MLLLILLPELPCRALLKSGALVKGDQRPRIVSAIQPA
jgi:hypothetical protein